MDVQQMAAAGADARIELDQDRIVRRVGGAGQAQAGSAGICHGENDLNVG
jgi:hypothetical protein